MNKSFDTEEFSKRLSSKTFRARLGRVKEALKGESSREIEGIFRGDCDFIDPVIEPGDTPLVGVRFDEEKMVNFLLEKLYPGVSHSDLYEELLEKITDYEGYYYETDGYLFFRDAQDYDEIKPWDVVYDDLCDDVEFRIPDVADDVFCKNFFLCYLELRLEENQ